MLASRSDVEKIGGHSKDAATSVSDIVNSTRGLVLTSGRTSKYDADAQKVCCYTLSLKCIAQFCDCR
jgi:hypothetical protein